MAERLANGIDEHGWGFLAVQAPGISPFIGFVGLAPVKIDVSFAQCVEIGWRLARPFWGKGYATEAARVALQVAFEFLGLEDLVAFTAAGNCRSQALMRRLGMRHDREFFDHPGVAAGHALRRHVLYRLILRDWAAHRLTETSAPAA